MSENGNPTTKNNQQPAAPTTALTLTITFDQMTGAVNVNGPIANFVLCCGMMEAAKDAIREHIRNASKGIVIAPPNMNLRM